MIVASKSLKAIAVLFGALVVSVTIAPAPAQNFGTIADKDGLFIDGKNFQIVPGKARDDLGNRLTALGAREIGPGAIIFRSGDRLYIAGAPTGTPILEPPKGAIHISYEPIKDPEHQQIYDRARERQALEMVKLLLSPFQLPVDLNIKMVPCDGVANAWFDRDGKNRTIRICYELLKAIMDKLPKETTAEGIEPQDAMVGQFLFAVLHETGHAMYDIFNVPVLGHQEDAADQFATWIMLQFGGERAHRVIRGAAYSYAGYIKALKDDPKVTLPLAAFSSDHGQPEERFFNLACIAYGYDPKIFTKVVDLKLLPQSRAKKCKFEYEDLTDAMHQLIGPHVDKELAKKVLANPWVTDNLPSIPSSSPPTATAPSAFEKPPAALK
jgi:hypothetical protein